ncbi:MAG: hypothetical protein ABII96_01520, partial [Candidatus Zixiibacteriota bacterium]
MNLKRDVWGTSGHLVKGINKRGCLGAGETLIIKMAGFYSRHNYCPEAKGASEQPLTYFRISLYLNY